MKFRNIHSPLVALRWAAQCLLVFFIMLSFLFALDDLRHNILVTAIGTTSIGSSAFLAFVAHDSPMANNYRLIGGYTIALIVGGIMHYVIQHYSMMMPFNLEHGLWFFAALAMGLTMMIMTLVNLPHAPAAGLSLGMTLRFWDIQTLTIMCMTVLLIAALKTLLSPWLINLTHDRKN